MSETNVSESEAFLDKHFSLSEILGDNWQERCLGTSLAEALSAEELAMIDSGVEPTIAGGNSEDNLQALWLRNIVEKSGSPYKVILGTLPSGEKKIILVGNVEGDVVVQILSSVHCFMANAGVRIASWNPEKMFIAGKGGVIKMHEITKDPAGKDEKQIALDFYEADTRQVRLGVGGEDADERLFASSGNPKSGEDMASMWHELGHALRKRSFNKKEIEVQRSLEDQGERVMASGRTFHNENTDSIYTIRRFYSLEERSSWAIPISILREAGKKVRLAVCSRESTRRMKQIAERSLKTYDKQFANSFKGINVDRMIPAFSEEQRRAARALQSELKKQGLQYQDLPAFDGSTGENLANDPQRLLKILTEQPHDV